MKRETIRRVETEEQAREVQRPHVSHWSKHPHLPKYCCAAVHDGGRSVGFHQCGRKPKHWYGSLGYCNQHDPNAVLERREKNEAEYRLKMDAYVAGIEAKTRARLLGEACIDAVQKIAAGHNDPRGLCLELLRQHKVETGE